MTAREILTELTDSADLIAAFVVFVALCVGALWLVVSALFGGAQ